MRLVVGLGNPGREYEGTRHNAGFEVVERIAARKGLPFERLRSGWLKRTLGEWALDRGAGFGLLKPQTFMNRSGEAVVEAAKRLGVEAGSVLAVSDDIALPPGALRIRAQGSSGGHKGLQSIADHLGTEAFPRLRVGIGPAKGDPADYVLSAIPKGERAMLEESFGRAAEAVELWLRTGDLERCMNEFNRAESG